MDNNENERMIYYQSVINNLETVIKEGEFKSKEELNNYLLRLKSNGIPEEILSDEKILGFLNLYDEYHPVMENDLNLQNYKGVDLETQNLIVSTETDEILKTSNNKEELSKEFSQIQNEITASNKDGLVNANEVFNHLRDNKKEEMTFIPITEAINTNIEDAEVLYKIKFFLSNEHINPYSYKVNTETGIFYNDETKEAFEVRKNELTNEYEIYKGSEVVYSDQDKTETSEERTATNINDEFEKEQDSPEEEKAYEQKNSKVRRLIKPSNNKSAAFVKSTFLVIVLTILTVLLSVAVMYNR